MPTVLPQQHAELESTEHESRPDKPSAPTPWTRIDLRDLDHPGTKAVLTCPSLTLSTLVSNAIHAVHTHLDPHHTHGLSPARSVSLIFRPCDGVAYTTGKDFDDDHKEIHFSTKYIASRAQSLSPADLAHEIVGVVTHEMVHVWQFNGQGDANGGLIEGIADWVRLQAGLAPPHWKRVVEDRKWDQGYETTAFFLEWLESKYGKGTVRKINQRLEGKYVEDEFWRGLFGGRSVHDLWKRYVAAIESAHEEDNQRKREDSQRGGQEQLQGQIEGLGEEQASRTSSESLRQWEMVSHAHDQ